MKPTGISEQLIFSTVRLIADNGKCGTGYFYNFRIGKHGYYVKSYELEAFKPLIEADMKKAHLI